jgi:predicted ATPase/class 3 adenylate cyclase/predicted negative regulator of RcsB-dependent stress response
MMSPLPSGTVTFLFTDIEGSTKIAQQYPQQWETLRARHHAILHQAMQAHNGYVFQIIGDAFCVAFHTAIDALNAAVLAQRLFQQEPWSPAPIKVRIGINTGTAQVSGDDPRSGGYTGYTNLVRVQRVMSVAYGGQSLLSNTSAELVRVDFPDGVTLRDLGEHRLKGLLNPEHLWQVAAPDLPQDFPPLQSLNAIPNNLPIQLTSFIGREQEMVRVKELLNGARLVSLTGAGGAGKTRLALQVAADLIDEFPDGVWFVELAPLTGPGLIPQTVASLLGLREEAGRPALTMLSDYLRAKTSLFILDNCEHLIDACAKFADAILHAAPKIKIFATSREALGIGETAYRVPSLSLPPTDFQSLRDFGNLTHYEAVRLFIDRALAVKTDFTVTNANAPAVAQICHQLDGIPLAIELAAASVDLLSLQEINKGMDNRFRLLTGGSRTKLPRHQTLKRCLDWSWDLLSEEEQVLFRRLSVFAGTWTMEDAEQVCSHQLPMNSNPSSLGTGNRLLTTNSVFNVLASLVRKSLVSVEAREDVTRYRLLETIRLYALERLTAAGEATRFAARHRDWYLYLAETFESDARAKKPTPNWIARLASDVDNLRATLELCLAETDGAEKGLRMSGALGRFWEKQNALTEGREWLRKFIDLTINSSDVLSRARALYWAGKLAQSQGDHAKAITFFDQCLKIETQDNLDLAQTYSERGVAFFRLADYESAAKDLERALQLGKTIGDPVIVARAHMVLGNIYHEHGDFDRAIENHRRALEKFREAGYLPQAAAALNNIARIYVALTDYDQAIELYTQAIQMNEKLKNYNGLAVNYINLSEIQVDLGNCSEATDLLNKCLEIAERLGNDYFKAVAWGDIAICRLNQGELESALDFAERALELIRKVQGKDQEGVIYRKLGEIRAMLGQRREAREAFESGRKILEPLRTNLELARLYRSYGKLLLADSETNTEGVDYVKRARAIFTALGSRKEVENTKMLLDRFSDQR